ncbi:MAG TPA: GC-type dockerin domain-anchored protein, partial [Phycisphaerales bacterium]|nr:GC-type dockerin domain-anchored protein [Phycisphaerales bacterium]
MNRSSTPLALALLAGLAAPSLAQIPLPPYTRWAMPDFDQRREGLAGNGSNHCVPTAHCNMLAYIADHGFAPMFPGVSHSWNPLEYDDITDNVHDLGVMMSTSGTNGTTGSNKQAGFNQWKWSHGGAFLFNINYQSGPDVTPWDMYFAMTGGGLVCFSYGRWSYNASEGEYQRNGGHCVTLRGIADLQFPFQPNTVRPLLRYRDPASDEGNVSGRLTGQSTFKTSELRIRPFTSDFEGYGDATFWKLITDSDDGVQRLIDGFTSITPVFYMQNNMILGQLSVYTPVQMIDSTNQGGVSLPGLVDAAFGKTAAHVFGLANNATGGTSRLVLANPIAGQITHTLTIPGQNGRLAPGREGDVFVFNNALITRYRPSDDEPLLLPYATSQPITAGVSNICYDDGRDGPTLLMGDGSVREYDKSLASFVNKTLATSPGWPGTAGPSHRRIIAVNEPGPAGAEYWFGPLTGNQIKRYAPAPGVPTRLVLVETVTPPPGATLVDFSLSDGGSLLLNRGGVLQELVKNDAGEWGVDPASPFNGLPAGGPIRVSRSRTNYNPAIHDLPGWNIDIINPEPIAAEVPDCLADLGRTGGLAEPDGQLNNNDFVVFIDFFFAADLRADIGSVGGVPGPDGFHNNNDFVVFIDRF